MPIVFCVCGLDTPSSHSRSIEAAVSSKRLAGLRAITSDIKTSEIGAVEWSEAQQIRFWIGSPGPFFCHADNKGGYAFPLLFISSNGYIRSMDSSLASSSSNSITGFQQETARQLASSFSLFFPFSLINVFPLTFQSSFSFSEFPKPSLDSSPWFVERICSPREL